MAKRKRTPTESRITREPTTAYARRQRTEGGDEEVDDAEADGTVKPPRETAAGSGPIVPAAKADAAPPAPPTAPVAAAPAPPAPAPAPTPAPAAAPAPEPPAAEAVKKLPLMPHPSRIPPGNPEDPADPPGKVPPGDSRSLRRATDFVLVYRVANVVVSRFGAIGKRGQFRVVEYPTTTYASNAYARECSRWVAEGYSDYRGP